jgi:ribonuclease BN (tRNA processing enzyme)
MKLVVLGANGYRPNHLGHTACYAIPELGLVLDAGTGMWRMADYLETEELDVYLSHSHPDHTWGLAYLEFMFWRARARAAAAQDSEVRLGPIFHSLDYSAPRVRVHAAQEHQNDVKQLVERFRDYSLIEFVPLKPEEATAGGGRLTSFSIHHRADELCFGFRLDLQGSSLAYITDTYGEPGASYVGQIQGVDLLLHECYLPDGEPDLARRIGHSHTTPVAQLAAEAGVGRLVLIHLNPLRLDAGEPELDRANRIFPGTEAAFDGMEIEF